MTKNIKLFSLIMNVVAIVIASVLLIGATYAWFNDAATSSGNKIQAGTLKVDLELLDPEQDAWVSLKGNNAPIFDYENWEPGYTDIKVLKVENEGSLALKWKAKFVSNAVLTELADVIDVYVLASEDVELTYPADRSLAGYTCVGTVAEFVNTIESTTYGTLLGGDSAYLGLALKMRENVGNEYQGLDLGGTFDIQIVATQLSSEEDGFGDDYDANVPYIVDSGAIGGISWTLDDAGKLTVSPNGDGSWTEAVIYDANGTPSAIGGYPYDVKAVKSLVIEEGVTSIGSFTAKFPNLTGEVVIPSTVTYIGQEAFQNCPITKLTFAEGGTEELCIAPGALKNMKVKEIVFPADRPEIHIHCWAMCDNTTLESVIFPANITTFSKWTHVEYCGMDYVDDGGSSILARAKSLKTIIFGSQEVHDLFFNAGGNRTDINAIGNVTIEIQQ